MLTSTINTTTWDATNSQSRGPGLTIRSYSLVRPGKMLAFVAGILLILPPFLSRENGGSLVLPLLVAVCGLLMLWTASGKPLGKWFQSTLPVRLSWDLYLGICGGATTFYLFSSGHRQPAMLLSTAAVGLIPVAAPLILKHRIAQKKLIERVLIVGTGDLAAKLCAALESETSFSYQAVSVSGEQAVQDIVAVERLEEIVSRCGISRIVVAENDAQTRSRMAAALVDLRLRGIKVSDAADFYEQLFSKIWIEVLNSEWFVYTSGFHFSRASDYLKRFADVVLSLLLLVATAPLLIILAIAIRLDSPGPALFRQDRAGLFGRRFTILKFRSMRIDAESQAGPRWASENDDRTTRVGRFLRKYRLDEIPQAINVLRGEMSMVGPRPERPCFVEQLKAEIPFYDLRHYVKPGITGWAQVKYRHGASIEDAYKKLQYDIYYAKHRSLAWDLRILFSTARIVLFGKGR